MADQDYQTTLEEWLANGKQIDEYYAYLKQIVGDKLADIQDAKLKYVPAHIELPTAMYVYKPADLPNLATHLANSDYDDFSILWDEYEEYLKDIREAFGVHEPQEPSFKKQSNYLKEHAAWSANQIEVEKFLADFKKALEKVQVEREKADEQYAFKAVEIIFTYGDSASFTPTNVSEFETFLNALPSDSHLSNLKQALSIKESSVFDAIKSQNPSDKPFFNPYRQSQEAIKYDANLTSATQFFDALKATIAKVEQEKVEQDAQHVYRPLTLYTRVTGKDGKSISIFKGDEETVTLWNKIALSGGAAVAELEQWNLETTEDTYTNEKPQEKDFFFRANYQTALDSWQQDYNTWSQFKAKFPATLAEVKRMMLESDEEMKYVAAPLPLEWTSQTWGITIKSDIEADPKQIATLGEGDIKAALSELQSYKQEKLSKLDVLKPQKSEFYYEEYFQPSLSAWETDKKNHEEFFAKLEKLYNDALTFLQNPTPTNPNESTIIPVEYFRWETEILPGVVFCDGKHYIGTNPTSAEIGQKFSVANIDDAYSELNDVVMALTEIRSRCEPQAADDNYSTKHAQWENESNELETFYQSIYDTLLDAHAIAKREAHDSALEYRPFKEYRFTTPPLPNIQWSTTLEKNPDAQSLVNKFIESELREARNGFVANKQTYLDMHDKKEPDTEDFLDKSKGERSYNLWRDDRDRLIRLFDYIEKTLDEAIAIEASGGNASGKDKYPWIDIVWEPTINGKSVTIEQIEPVDYTKLTAFSQEELVSLEQELDKLNEQYARQIWRNEPERQDYSTDAAYDRAVNEWNENARQNSVFWADIKQAIARAASSDPNRIDPPYQWVKPYWALKVGGRTKKVYYKDDSVDYQNLASEYSATQCSQFLEDAYYQKQEQTEQIQKAMPQKVRYGNLAAYEKAYSQWKENKFENDMFWDDIERALDSAAILSDCNDYEYRWIEASLETNYHGTSIKLSDTQSYAEIRNQLESYDAATLVYIDSQIEPIGRAKAELINAQNADDDWEYSQKAFFNEYKKRNTRYFQDFYDTIRYSIKEILGISTAAADADEPVVIAYVSTPIKWELKEDGLQMTFLAGEPIDYRSLGAFSTDYLKSTDVAANETHYKELIEAKKPRESDYQDDETAFNVALERWNDDLALNARFWTDVSRAIETEIMRRRGVSDVGYHWVEESFRYIYGTGYIEYTLDILPTQEQFNKKLIGELNVIKDALPSERQKLFDEIEKLNPYQEGDRDLLDKVKKQNRASIVAFYSLIKERVNVAIVHNGGEIDPEPNEGGDSSLDTGSNGTPKEEIDAAVVNFLLDLGETYWDVPLNRYNQHFVAGDVINYGFFAAFSPSEINDMLQDIGQKSQKRNAEIQAAKPTESQYKPHDVFLAVYKEWENVLKAANDFWKDLKNAISLGQEILAVRKFHVYEWVEVEWKVADSESGLREHFNDRLYLPTLKPFENLNEDALERVSFLAAQSKRDSLHSIEFRKPDMDRLRLEEPSIYPRVDSLIKENIRRVNHFFDDIIIPLLRQAKERGEASDKAFEYKSEPYYVQWYGDEGRLWTFGLGDEDNLDTLLKDASESTFRALANYDFTPIEQLIDDKTPDLFAFFSEANETKARDAWLKEKDDLKSFKERFVKNVEIARKKRIDDDSHAFQPLSDDYFVWSSDKMPDVRYAETETFPVAEDIANKYDVDTLRATYSEFADVAQQREQEALNTMPIVADFFSEASYQTVYKKWNGEYERLVRFLGRVKESLDSAIAKKTGETPTNSVRYSKVKIEWRGESGDVIAESGMPIPSLRDYEDEFLNSVNFDSLEANYDDIIKRNLPERMMYADESAYNADYKLWNENLSENKTFWADVRNAVANAKAFLKAKADDGYYWIANEFSYVYKGMTVQYGEDGGAHVPTQKEFNKKPFSELETIQKCLDGALNSRISEVDAQTGTSGASVRCKTENKKSLAVFFERIKNLVFNAISYQQTNGRVNDNSLKLIQKTNANISFTEDDGRNASFQSGETVDYEKLLVFSVEELDKFKKEVSAEQLWDEGELESNAPKDEMAFRLNEKRRIRQPDERRLKYHEALDEWQINYDENAAFWKETREAVDTAHKIVAARQNGGSDVPFQDIPQFDAYGATDADKIGSEIQTQYQSLNIKEIAEKERALIDQRNAWRDAMCASYPNPVKYPTSEEYDRAVKEWRQKFDEGRGVYEIARTKIDEIIRPIVPESAEFALTKVDRARERKYGEEKAEELRRETQKYHGRLQKGLFIKYNAVPTAEDILDGVTSELNAARKRGDSAKVSILQAKCDLIRNRIEFMKSIGGERGAVYAEHGDWMNRIDRARALETLDQVLPDKGGSEFFDDSYVDSVISQSKARRGGGFGEQAEEAMSFLSRVAKCYNTGGRPYKAPSRFAFGDLDNSLGCYDDENRIVWMSSKYGLTKRNTTPAERFSFHSALVHEHVHGLVINNLGAERENANVAWIKRITGQSTRKQITGYERGTLGYLPERNKTFCWREYSYRAYNAKLRHADVPGVDSLFVPTEVITTAAEALACHPEVFIRMCPEQFELLLDNLRELRYNTPNSQGNSPNP